MFTVKLESSNSFIGVEIDKCLLISGDKIESRIEKTETNKPTKNGSKNQSKHNEKKNIAMKKKIRQQSHELGKVLKHLKKVSKIKQSDAIFQTSVFVKNE